MTLFFSKYPTHAKTQVVLSTFYFPVFFFLKNFIKTLKLFSKYFLSIFVFKLFNFKIIFNCLRFHILVCFKLNVPYSQLKWKTSFDFLAKLTTDAKCTCIMIMSQKEFCSLFKITFMF